MAMSLKSERRRERNSALVTPSESVKTPTRRVILLGASNLVRSFPAIVATAQRTWCEPVEIMAAMGHGRSYGQDSTVLGRKISGIFPCSLWQELPAREPLPTAALITDIGNDFLYGVTSERLFEWVERCVDRLEEVGATIVVTQLPSESIESLSELRFRFFRRLLFPRSRITLADARVMVGEFNERLARLGETRKVAVIPVFSAWYGLDPIHLKRDVLHMVWPELLAAWRGGGEPCSINRPSLRSTLSLMRLAPAERWLFGIRRCAAQPCGALSDGTTISLY
jgi:hypothetical protein